MMSDVGSLFQKADWKTEKHVPVIEAPEKAKKQQAVACTVSVGKEIAHPNTTEHYIRWIEVYFHPQGEKFPYSLGRFEFDAHGASVQGPNTSTVFTEPAVVCHFKTEKPGTLLAVSFCNIHGLWQSTRDLGVE